MSMKPEEAIRHYKALHEDYKSKMGDYYKERFDEMGEEVVVLLDKQVPKKPINDGHCPDCFSDNDYPYNEERVRYCPSCGQKLDWRG